MATVARQDLQLDIVSRLERGFEEQQSALLHARDDVNQLKSGYNVIQRDMMSLTSAIEKLVARFEDTRKTNWPLLALAAGLLPIIIGGFGFFVTSFTGNAIAPIHAEIMQIQTATKNLDAQIHDIATIEGGRAKDISLLAQTTTANTEILSRLTERVHSVEESTTKSAAADEQSRSDRAQLNQRLQKLETQMSVEMSERKSQAAETRVELAEVEQQFHSVSNLENLRAAQQERLNAMLWEKSHPGDRYPNGTFFPTSIFQGQGGAAPMSSSVSP